MVRIPQGATLMREKLHETVQNLSQDGEEKQGASGDFEGAHKRDGEGGTFQ